MTDTPKTIDEKAAAWEHHDKTRTESASVGTTDSDTRVMPDGYEWLPVSLTVRCENGECLHADSARHAQQVALLHAARLHGSDNSHPSRSQIWATLYVDANTAREDSPPPAATEVQIVPCGKLSAAVITGATASPRETAQRLFGDSVFEQKERTDEGTGETAEAVDHLCTECDGLGYWVGISAMRHTCKACGGAG